MSTSAPPAQWPRAPTCACDQAITAQPIAMLKPRDRSRRARSVDGLDSAWIKAGVAQCELDSADLAVRTGSAEGRRRRDAMSLPLWVLGQ
jgi:hypothetical protein